MGLKGDVMMSEVLKRISEPEGSIDILSQDVERLKGKTGKIETKKAYKN